MSDGDRLAALGWRAFFADQVDPEVLAATPPARVVRVDRTSVRVTGSDFDAALPFEPDIAVGDWVLVDRGAGTVACVLGRHTLISRRAAGLDRQVVTQLIAANIDTAFIVTSCNRDFNVARLERYLVLTMDAGMEAVIVLTKADLCDDPEAYARQAGAISDRVPVVILDARDEGAVTTLAPWCGAGRTVAFLGSSGVGKSTLVNALSGGLVGAETGAIRESDARGRHTTTRRELHPLPQGFSVLDTPGMRELQLTDVAGGIDDLFPDLAELAQACRFSDCAHLAEPGCALRAAVDAGEVDPDRLARWQKLAAEDRGNTERQTARRKPSGRRPQGGPRRKGR
ncbi:ribosome small subunit-dependent GTPase A [Jannaschia rubra]|uniref:ribosome small subunit-dependent GTPase A n=1 Tax=Jannaschia rubra TaxID=282197 RepID=UPI00248F4E48|nr:ribosome small subunit-dependent GTPase A [Jannaschia rubra]